MVFGLYQEVNQGDVVWFHSNYILWGVGRVGSVVQIVAEQWIRNRVVSRMYVENKI